MQRQGDEYSRREIGGSYFHWVKPLETVGGKHKIDMLGKEEWRTGFLPNMAKFGTWLGIKWRWGSKMAFWTKALWFPSQFGEVLQSFRRRD